MKKEKNTRNFIKLLEEIWEEVEIQFFGIIGAITFFIIFYLFFRPSWMRPLINFLENIKLSFGNY